MRGYYYTVYKDEEHRNVASGREERFSKARHENTKGYKNTSYNAIQENGIPIKNAVVQENDVVIGKGVTSTAICLRHTRTPSLPVSTGCGRIRTRTGTRSSRFA